MTCEICNQHNVLGKDNFKESHTTRDHDTINLDDSNHEYYLLMEKGFDLKKELGILDTNVLDSRHRQCLNGEKRD